MAQPKSRLAVDGYDLVTYFSGKSPELGKAKFRTQWNGMTYCFINEANLNAFKKNPYDYLPQFGGNCAFRCGLWGGITVASPLYWKIVNGKLYLTKSSFGLKLWDMWPSLIHRGQINYHKYCSK